MPMERLILAAILIGVIIGAVVPFGSASETTKAPALPSVPTANTVADLQKLESEVPPTVMERLTQVIKPQRD